MQGDYLKRVSSTSKGGFETTNLIDLSDLIPSGGSLRPSEKQCSSPGVLVALGSSSSCHHGQGSRAGLFRALQAWPCSFPPSRLAAGLGRVFTHRLASLPAEPGSPRQWREGEEEGKQGRWLGCCSLGAGCQQLAPRVDYPRVPGAVW